MLLRQCLPSRNGFVSIRHRLLTSSRDQIRHASTSLNSTPKEGSCSSTATNDVMLDFENNRPFQNQNIKVLLRSLAILKLCSYDVIVNNSEKVKFT